MFSYGKDSVQRNLVFTDYEAIGIVSIDDINNQPFYSFKYKGKSLAVNDEKCGGNCLDFLDSFLDIYFL